MEVRTSSLALHGVPGMLEPDIRSYSAMKATK